MPKAAICQSAVGIGILYCFMSDPEHNKLQLSTKRFAQPGSPVPAAIRMNVDGLHGYYYLAEEGTQVTESALLTMNHPFGEGENQPLTEYCHYISDEDFDRPKKSIRKLCGKQIESLESL